MPAESSTSAQVWKTASGKWRTAEEALATTVAEAEVHAVALIRSGLEHADEVARSVTRGLAYTPHTLARTAEEHLLRALHYLDVERCTELGSHEDQVKIAEVRFDQVLANLIESGRLTASVGRSEWAELADTGSVAEQWEWIDARTKALG